MNTSGKNTEEGSLRTAPSLLGLETDGSVAAAANQNDCQNDEPYPVVVKKVAKTVAVHKFILL